MSLLISVASNSVINCSKNLVWVEGLYEIPSDKGFVFGNQRLAKMFPILSEIWAFLL